MLLGETTGINMNRTIKFRGKRIDNGEWVFGDLLHGPAEKTYIDEHGCYEVIPDTVGQYVGCIYGEELYEGDIVRSDLGFKISAGVVKQKEDCYAWYVFHKEGSCRLTYAIDNSMLDEAFILGNIHDNPELLEDLR
jgi:uncharacterized phage protein (TIGR01671 family)